ncbi:hypothetical protein PBY51_024788 [Eleginops maclovinus]|uniref:Uncharacterized protein n=1 Tax=Eleginops maclovinus TaxID=56733 RepID=A0AAN8AWC9_ELEMC|nr:hypothetical protein PBY51_024788 [Eleginops maclovinus]
MIRCESRGYKKIRVIRGESRLVSALPDPVQGFVNYSSLSHLSLAKADPVRRPDIPKTTVSGVVCPCPLFVSTHTRTHGTTCPRCKNSPQRASMSRNDTWHSPLVSAAILPHRQPSEIPK